MSDSLDPLQVLAGLMGAADRRLLAAQLGLFVRRYLRNYGVDESASPRSPEEFVKLGVGDALSGEHQPDARTLFMFFAGAVAKRIDRELDAQRSASQEKFTHPAP